MKSRFPIRAKLLRPPIRGKEGRKEVRQAGRKEGREEAKGGRGIGKEEKGDTKQAHTLHQGFLGGPPVGYSWA